MAIFNSYVKLPEGKSVSLVDFSRKMLDEIDEMFKKNNANCVKNHQYFDGEFHQPQ